MVQIANTPNSNTDTDNSSTSVVEAEITVAPAAYVLSEEMKTAITDFMKEWLSKERQGRSGDKEDCGEKRGRGNGNKRGRK